MPKVKSSDWKHLQFITVATRSHIFKSYIIIPVPDPAGELTALSRSPVRFGGTISKGRKMDMERER